MLVVEVDGRPARAVDVLARAVPGDAHYTAMQVRGGAVRGLAHHLARLDAATRELFDQPLDGDAVRRHVRHALATAGAADAASVRVDVFRAAPGAAASVMVTVGRAAEAPAAPQRLAVARYARPFAHLKHAGTFAQVHHARLARRAGFDDALLVAPGDLVAETTIANVGFLDGGDVVWPEAPALAGITMQVLAPLLRSVRRPVPLAGLGRFDGAFLANSHGIAAVGSVDGAALPPTDAALVRAVTDAYESVPHDPL